VLVDYERAWHKLKTVIAAKRSHGQDGLFAEMVRLEVVCNTDEDPDLAGSPRNTEDADEGPLPEAVLTAAGDAHTSKPTRRQEATYGHQGNGKPRG